MVVQWIKDHKVKFGLIVGGVIVAVAIIITFSILAANGALFNTNKGNDITTDSATTDSDTTDSDIDFDITDSDIDSDTTDSDIDSDTTDSDIDSDTTDTPSTFTISDIPFNNVIIELVFTKSVYTISEKPVWVASTSEYGDIYLMWNDSNNGWACAYDVTWSSKGSILSRTTSLYIYENDRTKTDLDMPSTDIYFKPT